MLFGFNFGFQKNDVGFGLYGDDLFLGTGAFNSQADFDGFFKDGIVWVWRAGTEDVSRPAGALLSHFYKQVPTVAGKTYRLQATANITSGDAEYYIGNGLPGTVVGEDYEFVAGADNLEVGVVSVDGDFNFDNLILREILSDTLYNRLFFGGDTSITFDGTIDLSQDNTLRYQIYTEDPNDENRVDVWGTSDNQNYMRVSPTNLRFARGGTQWTWNNDLWALGKSFLVEEQWVSATQELTITLTNLITMEQTQMSPRVCDIPVPVAGLKFGDRALGYTGINGSIWAFGWYDGTDTIKHRWTLDNPIANGGTIPDEVGNIDGTLNLGDGYWTTGINWGEVDPTIVTFKGEIVTHDNEPVTYP